MNAIISPSELAGELAAAGDGTGARSETGPATGAGPGTESGPATQTGPATETGPGGTRLCAAPTLLDVRWQLGGPPGRPAYDAGHLPGAGYVDLDTELAAPPGSGGRHPLPDLAAFGAAMRRAGVSRDRAVVVYDGGQGWAAARAWWLLRWTGHPAVRVLDGGLAAWTAAGGEITAEVAEVPEGDFTPEPGPGAETWRSAGPGSAEGAPGPQSAEGVRRAERTSAAPGPLRLLDAAEAAALARRGVLLDARAPERYRGEVEPIDPVGGHIPGALSAPTTENVGPDGRFLPPEALAARFAGLGVKPGGEVGVYCGSGVSAAHQVLALTVAGIDAALYAGSWSEWCADPDRPVATGPQPG